LRQNKGNYILIYLNISIAKANIKQIVITVLFEKHRFISQIRYSLVVIPELNSVSEVQYKGMMTDR